MAVKKMEDAQKTCLSTFILVSNYEHHQAHLLYTNKKNTVDNLTLHPKQLEIREQKPPKISGRKEIIRIKAEINEKEMKETIVKINKTGSWFFEKINKIDKPLARLVKNREELNQQN